MKLEKFKEKKKVKVSVIVLGCFCLVAVGYLLHRTFASSKVDSFDGSNTYFAFYNEGVAVDTMPVKDSGLSFINAECTNGASVAWNKETWEPTIKNLTKTKTKCTLYFIQSKNLANEILKNATGKSDPEEAKRAIEEKRFPNFGQKAETNEGMYSLGDDLGESYYYRGVVDNNFVKFAGFYWRIIRINGDGSIRLIYNGPNANQTGESTQVQNSVFNGQDNDPAYVGYMYGNTLHTSKEQTQANEVNSNMKVFLENWYEENLSTYNTYIADAIFCNDRSVTRGNGYSVDIDIITYSPYTRIYDRVAPILACREENNEFTVSATLGNGKNVHPIGLITADELSLAGSSFSSNKAFYLYTGVDYWTMSPYYFNADSVARVWLFSSDGMLDILNDANSVRNSHGVRPVINLKADTAVTGSGTSTDPFVVV